MDNKVVLKSNYNHIQATKANKEILDKLIISLNEKSKYKLNILFSVLKNCYGFIKSIENDIENEKLIVENFFKNKFEEELKFMQSGKKTEKAHKLNLNSLEEKSNQLLEEVYQTENINKITTIIENKINDLQNFIYKENTFTKKQSLIFNNISKLSYNSFNYTNSNTNTISNNNSNNSSFNYNYNNNYNFNTNSHFNQYNDSKSNINNNANINNINNSFNSPIELTNQSNKCNKSIKTNNLSEHKEKIKITEKDHNSDKDGVEDDNSIHSSNKKSKKNDNCVYSSVIPGK